MTGTTVNQRRPNARRRGVRGERETTRDPVDRESQSRNSYARRFSTDWIRIAKRTRRTGDGSLRTRASRTGDDARPSFRFRHDRCASKRRLPGPRRLPSARGPLRRVLRSTCGERPRSQPPGGEGGRGGDTVGALGARPRTRNVRPAASVSTRLTSADRAWQMLRAESR